MNYLGLKVELEKELNNLKELVEYWKRLKSDKDLSQNAKKEASYNYDLACKKLLRVKELLTILDYINLKESTTLDNKLSKKETLESIEELLDLLKTSKQDLDTLMENLLKEIVILNSQIQKTELAKDREELKKQRSIVQGVVDFIRYFKKAFNTTNEEEVKTHLQNMYNEIKEMSIDEYKNYRIEGIKTTIKEKLDTLESSKKTTLDENIQNFEFDLTTLENIAHLSNLYMGLYYACRTIKKSKIDAETLEKTPILFQKELEEYSMIPMSDIDSLINIVNEKLIRNYNLQERFWNEYDAASISELIEAESVKFVEQKYPSLLEKYSEKGVFDNAFIEEKTRNFKEYKGEIEPDKEYYREDKNRLLERLGTDFKEIKELIIEYLITNASEYSSIGINSIDIENLFEQNSGQRKHVKSTLGIQSSLKSLYEKIRSNCIPCIDYYNELLSLKRFRDIQLKEISERITKINGDFVMVVQEQITPQIADKLCDMTKIKELLADLYQQEIFKRLFKTTFEDSKKKALAD